MIKWNGRGQIARSPHEQYPHFQGKVQKFYRVCTLKISRLIALPPFVSAEKWFQNRRSGFPLAGQLSHWAF
jgi:hypothetical protein